MKSRFIITGASLALIAIILGAFGAHILKEKIGLTDLQNFETGIRYQMYHAIAILLLGLLYDQYRHVYLHIAFWLFLAGTILFSVSIYLLATKELTGFFWAWLGPVTPIGGLMLIAGWAMLILTVLKNLDETD
jgi:uncharacterized membrane protein YgdD (TMEM256/DUF423 family)